MRITDYFATQNERGIALVLVLAFVVLVTGLVVAYFSRTMTDRQLSNVSFNQSAADQLAASALAVITGDLKQEIVNGSTAQTPNPAWPPVYLPASNASMVPVRNGVPAAWGAPWSTPNTTLLRVSSSNPIAFPGVDPPASNAVSTGISANGRSISLSRWNRHYLIPLNNSNSPGDTTPNSNFNPPAWVYVTGAGGPTQLAAPSSSVIGRYAYAIYDEGALLDVNAAGFPCDPSIYGAQPTTNGQMPVPYEAKGGAAYADLTALLNNLSLGPTQAGVNALIGWRNYASLQPSGIFPGLGFAGNSVLGAYGSLVRSNTNGFLTVSGLTTPGGLTDQAFLTRQELINLVQSIPSPGFNPNNLQFLGTFSRAVTAPAWSPTADSPNLPGYVGGSGASAFLYRTNAESAGIANRDLANVRFQQSGSVTHWSDGVISGSGTMILPMTSASYAVNAGDPLIQSRFSLAKIAWLSQADPSQGTFPSPNYATAIQGCFGLTWGGVGVANGGNDCWSYVGSAGNFNGTIETLDQVAAENPPREPNFFEILKAAILNGSLGLSPGPAAFQNGNTADPNYQTLTGTSSYPYSGAGCDGLYSQYLDSPSSTNTPAPAGISDLQIIQIGANIIDQYAADSYPTAIYFPYAGMTNSAYDAATAGSEKYGSTDMVYGDENLPELEGMAIITATVDGKPQGDGNAVPSEPSNDPSSTGTTSGLANWWQPVIWNSHQMPNPANSTVLMPTHFQIRANGQAYFQWKVQNDPLANPQSNQTAPQTFDNNQYINFTDSSPATSAFYAQPLLLTQNTIPSVVATTSSSQMMANSSMYDYAKNPFVGFFDGQDSKYTGSYGSVDVNPRCGPAVSFCLGWVDSANGFHPYSFLTGFSSYSYGTINNNIVLPQGGCLPDDTAAEDHVNVDPRTSRFSTTNNSGVTTIAVSGSLRALATYFPSKSAHNSDDSGWGQPAALNFHYGSSGSYYPSDWEVNQPAPLSTTGASPTYYNDPDGVVRPGDGAVGNASTGDGMLLYTVPGTGGSASGDTTAATSPASGSNTTGNTYHGRRSIILNRPFHSVGELGYTDRGLPFKTLDFFSTSSADAALLDVFSVTDQARVCNGQLNSVVAGQVNLNDAPSSVIAALLSGGSKKDFDNSYYYSNSLTSSTTAVTIAQGIFAALNSSSGPAATITNRAELVTRLGASAASGHGVILNAIDSAFPALPSPDVSNKAYLEAPVRALADAVNTRTWNLMIDVIAQAGSFSPNAPATPAALNSAFNVQGERRYWLHIAIDRWTGKVIDQQLEPVYE